MDILLMQEIFWPIFVTAIAIARVIRLVNGATFDSLFRFTKVEQATLYAYLIVLAIVGAFEDSAVRLVVTALACIVIIGLIGNRLHARRAVNHQPPIPDATSESN